MADELEEARGNAGCFDGVDGLECFGGGGIEEVGGDVDGGDVESSGGGW